MNKTALDSPVKTRFAAVVLALLSLLLVTLAAAPPSSWAVNVTLEWDANEEEEEVDGYRIYQRTISTQYDFSKPAYEGTPTSYIAVLPAQGRTYLWVARAYKGENESGNSNEVSLFVPWEPHPGIPSNAVITQENDVMFLTTAPMPAAEAKGFIVTVDGVAHDAVPEVVDATNVRLHFNLNALNLSDGAHDASVAAKNGWGAGAPTDPFVFTKTSPGVPSGVGLSED